jgi:hypothetical protein
MPKKTDPYPFKRLIDSAVDLGELPQGTATYVLDLFAHTAEARAARRQPRPTRKQVIAVLDRVFAEGGYKITVRSYNKILTGLGYRLTEPPPLRPR